MNRIRNIKKIVLLLTMPLVMWLFFNQVAFWHYHLLENGIVVEHAHPFKKSTFPDSPYQNHHHSDFEYSILAQVSNTFGLLVFLLIVGVFIQSVLSPLENAFKAAHVSSSYLFILSLRGPPIVS